MQWVSNIYRLGLKELRSLRADPVLLFLIAYVFSFAVYAVATGAKLEVVNASVAYVDLDRSDLTGRIVGAILPPEFDTPQEIAASDIDRVMNDGSYVFVLSFPPRFEALGIEEIGAGGVGAGLKGSADISADTLVDTLARAGERAAGGADGLRFTDRTDGRVGLALQDAMAVGDTEIGYGIALQLSPVSTTRIGIEALLDLRDIQARLPDLLADRVVTDNCGGRIQIEGFDTEADGTTIIARASLEMESYDCVRSAPG